MHNTKVEMQRKCRYLFYIKRDFPVPAVGNQIKAGQVLDVPTGGGATLALHGDDLINARFEFEIIEDLGELSSDYVAVLEAYYPPLNSADAESVDMAVIQTCHDAVTAHQEALQAEADFVFEKGIKLFGSEQPSTEVLRHVLKVQEMHTRDNPDRTADHDAIVQAQTDLAALCQTCEDCCEALLTTRDATVTYAEKLRSPALE